jgi:hypothetical protein
MTEGVREALKHGPKMIAGVAVMVQMDFHLPESLLAERRERVEQIGPVVLDGVEERVLRMPPIGIDEVRSYPWKSIDPGFDPTASHIVRHLPVQRLEMISNGEQDIHDTQASTRFTSGAGHRPDVVDQPDLSMSRQCDGHGSVSPVSRFL